MPRAKDVLAPRQRRILGILRNENKALTVRELVDKSGYHSVVISGDMKFLTSIGCVTRLVGPRGGYKYTFLSSVPATPEEPKTYKVEPLNRDMIIKYLRIVADKEYTPKFMRHENYQYVPYVANRLISLIHDAAHGAEIPRDKLQDLRQDLRNYLTYLESAMKLFGGLVATPELWEPRSITQYAATDSEHQSTES